MIEYAQLVGVIRASHGKRARLMTTFDPGRACEVRVFDLGKPVPGEGEGSRVLGYVPLERPPGINRWLLGWPMCGVRLDEILELVPLE